jgi:hypothetical protein
MTPPRQQESRGSEPRGSEHSPEALPDRNAGWNIFGYLLSGMLFYGAVGWLLGRLTHVAVLFPVGMLVGLVLAIVLIVYRYGRS